MLTIGVSILGEWHHILIIHWRLVTFALSAPNKYSYLLTYLL